MTQTFRPLRGNTAKNDAYKGLDGEITVDTEDHTIRVHDGVTRGGHALATAAAVTGVLADGDKGDITVSGGGATWTIDAGAVTLAKQADLATDRLIGRDTAGTGAPEALTVGGGIEFTGSGGVQRSALTGDVTASAGSGATTIASAAVGVAKMAASATDVLFGRSSSGAGAGEEIACTAAGRALLDDPAASNQRTTLGLGTAAVVDTGTGAANVMTTAQADARYLARALAQPFTAP